MIKDVSSIELVLENATCLHDMADINTALDRMAVALNYDLKDQFPLFLGVVVGAIVPLGNLLPRLNFPLAVDYIHATRYESGLSGHEVVFKAEPQKSLAGQVVVVFDDILDGGVTLSHIVRYCKNHGASRVLTAVMVEKLRTREPGGLAKADYTGLMVENRYVFGYGMDYHERLRNAPGIYAVSPEHDVGGGGR